MTQPPGSRDIAQLGHALMLGTRKRPVALPPSAAMMLPATSTVSPAMLALVLAGQHGRFERPSAPKLAPAAPEDLAMHADARAMLSDVSRRLLKQLLGIAKGDAPEAFLAACRDRAAGHGLRLHPFDLPALAPYMRIVGNDTPMGDAPPILHTATWTAMPQERRAAALRRYRHASPDAARALLEATFRSETAAHRASFVGVLGINLSAADLPFLEVAAKDRAEPVRTAALRLAGSIPGTDAYRERLNRAAALFLVREEKGKPRTLTLAGSKTAIGARTIPTDVFHNVEGLNVADVAARLGFLRDAFVEAIPRGDHIFLLAFIATAITKGDASLASALIRQLASPRALVNLWSYHSEGLRGTEHCRALIMETFLDLAIGGAFPDGQTLHTLYRIGHGPLPEPPAARLLASESWRTHVSRLAAPEADNKTPNAVKETALLIPDSLLGSFLAAISPLSPHITLPARLFAEFCQSLAETTPVAPLKPSS